MFASYESNGTGANECEQAADEDAGPSVPAEHTADEESGANIACAEAAAAGEGDREVEGDESRTSEGRREQSVAVIIDDGRGHEYAAHRD
jgi:hypothetical protein